MYGNTINSFSLATLQFQFTNFGFRVTKLTVKLVPVDFHASLPYHPIHRFFQLLSFDFLFQFLISYFDDCECRIEFGNFRVEKNATRKIDSWSLWTRQYKINGWTILHWNLSYEQHVLFFVWPNRKIWRNDHLNILWIRWSFWN